MNDQFNTKRDYLLVCGGFKPGEAIKVYDIEKEKEMEQLSIKINSSMTPTVIESFHDLNTNISYVILGTDKGLLIYNFKTKENTTLIKTKSLITSVKTSNSIRIKNVYFSEYRGTFRIWDNTHRKLTKETKLGFTILDFQYWDESSFIISGDCKDNGYKILYEGKSHLVNNFPHCHNKVILGTSVIENHFFGKLLVTLGADWKIKMYLQSRFYK